MSSSSRSSSSSPVFPIFFLLPCVLLLGSLLNAAYCAAPRINVNFLFSSSANSFNSYTSLVCSALVICVVELSVFSVFIPSNFFSNASIFFACRASNVLKSNSIFCSILFRFPRSSVVGWVALLFRVMVVWSCVVCFCWSSVICASSFLEASSFYVSLLSSLVRRSTRSSIFSWSGYCVCVRFCIFFTASWMASYLDLFSSNASCI